MTRIRIIDTFPMHDELDLLELRLTELYEAVDHFVIVEAEVTHQDVAKPFYYLENKERFAPWADKIVSVQARGLPTLKADPDPWSREHAQREHIATGLDRIGVTTDDVILQSDIDEIPRALQTRNCRPQGLVAFEQRLHCFAIDWLHPDPWMGTVAGRAGTIRALGAMPFGFMRDARNKAPCPPAYRNAGWHLSWLGGNAAQRKKLGAFCHPEIADRIEQGLANDEYLTEGWHVDGRKMLAVDVDDDYPKWIVAGNAPASWYRPRGEVAA